MIIFKVIKRPGFHPLFRVYILYFFSSLNARITKSPKFHVLMYLKNTIITIASQE